MHRYFLFAVAIVLAGTLLGMIIIGEYGNAPESTDGVDSLKAASVPDASMAAEAVGLSTANENPVSALSTAQQESSPTEANRIESDPRLESRLREMHTAWSGLRSEVQRLHKRLDVLEGKLSASARIPETTSQTAARLERPGTPEDRRSALVGAGVAEDRAADLVWRQDQQQLDQLELRDIATREGWFATDRYRAELSRINEDVIDLREEIGEDLYDRFLFETGENNRVQVDSIISGSVAEAAGLYPGDLIESYGDSRIFSLGDLQTATSEGERSELVPVRIRRGGELIDTWLPRGPLGVRVDRASVDPDA